MHIELYEYLFCKVVIYNYNSVSNLIVFFQFFPFMFVGFNVRVECESLVKNCENSEVRDWLATSLQVYNPQKAMLDAHAGI